MRHEAGEEVQREALVLALVRPEDEDVEAAQVWGAVPAGAWVVLLLEQLEVWAQPVAGLQLCWALLATALVSWTWVFSSSPSPAANSPLAC